jgi:hypothetical protein
LKFGIRIKVERARDVECFVLDCLKERDPLWFGEETNAIRRLKLLSLNDFMRCLPIGVAVLLMHVMMELEIPGLGSEVAVTPKPLDSKEQAIIGLIKAFDRSITSGFSNRDKDGFDFQGETKSEYDSEGSRVTVVPTESQLVVQLEKIG